MSKLIARKNIREGVDLAVIETGKASGGLVGIFVNLNLVEMPSDLDFSQFTRVDSKGVKLLYRLSHQISRAKEGSRVYNNTNRSNNTKEKYNMKDMMAIFDKTNQSNIHELYKVDKSIGVIISGIIDERIGFMA